MKNQMVIGIGCFAKPETLTRVFKKIMHAYTLGQFQAFDRIDGRDPTGDNGDQLLRALVTGKTECAQTAAADTRGGLGNKKISGFFLAFRDQRLNLSVFAKGDRPGHERYTADLAEFTALRQKRLN